MPDTQNGGDPRVPKWLHLQNGATTGPGGTLLTYEVCGVQLGRECGPDALCKKGPVATRALHDPLLVLVP